MSPTKIRTARTCGIKGETLLLSIKQRIFGPKIVSFVKNTKPPKGWDTTHSLKMLKIGRNSWKGWDQCVGTSLDWNRAIVLEQRSFHICSCSKGLSQLDKAFFVDCEPETRIRLDHAQKTAPLGLRHPTGPSCLEIHPITSSSQVAHSIGPPRRASRSPLRKKRGYEMLGFFVIRHGKKTWATIFRLT